MLHQLLMINNDLLISIDSWPTRYRPYLIYITLKTRTFSLIEESRTIVYMFLASGISVLLLFKFFFIQFLCQLYAIARITCMRLSVVYITVIPFVLIDKKEIVICLHSIHSTNHSVAKIIIGTLNNGHPQQLK